MEITLENLATLQADYLKNEKLIAMQNALFENDLTKIASSQ